MLLSFGVVEVGALDDAPLVPPDAELLDDVSELVDGGALDDDEEEDDGGDAVLGGDDMEDDVEPDGGVAGGVVVDDDDVDGDGVTTGGVVVVVDGSRLQPARPSTAPVQSTVINALLIAISNGR